MNNVEIQIMADWEKDYWWHRGKMYLINTLILNYFPNRKDLEILEIGCGAGEITKELLKYGSVVGVDLSEKAAEVCLSRGLPSILIGDINEIDLSQLGGKFDLVLALDVLEHIQDDTETMRRVRALLQDDGLFIVNVPAHKFLWSEHDEALFHKRRYHSFELTQKLKDSGFEIVKKSFYVCTASPAMAFYRIWGNLFGKSAYAKTSYVKLPHFLNELMVNILKLEAKIAAKWSLPFGVTLTVVAKPSYK